MNTDNQPMPSQSPAEPGGAKKFQLPKSISVKSLIIFMLVAAAVIYGYINKSVFIAATVDGRPISRLAVVKELEKQSGMDALDALVSQALIKSEAKKMNISVSDQELQEKIKIIEDQIVSQGSTLNDALEAQGMTRSDFEKQVILQRTAEEVLQDKIQVSAEDLDQYIKDNSITLEAGKEEQQKAQITENIKQQKFSQEIAGWLAEKRASANIKYFVNY